MVKGQASAVTRLCVSAGQGVVRRSERARGRIVTPQGRLGHHLTLQTRKLRPKEGKYRPKTVSPMHTRAMDSSLSSSHQPVPDGTIGRDRRPQQDQG